MTQKFAFVKDRKIFCPSEEENLSHPKIYIDLTKNNEKACVIVGKFFDLLGKLENDFIFIYSRLELSAIVQPL